MNAAAKTAIKFNKHHVAASGKKAGVRYSVDNRIDGRKCVTLYAKTFDGALGEILGDAYSNRSDMLTDYFENGKAVLFEGHPLYAVARVRAEQEEAAFSARVAARNVC